MKIKVRIIGVVMILCFVLLQLCSCLVLSSSEAHSVTYVYNNGKEDKIVTVEAGRRHTEPLNPQRSNYIFTGWYTEPTFKNRYEFGEMLNRDITIYAGWHPDYEIITNKLSQEYMRANVKIQTVQYSEGFFGQQVPTGEGSTGSGVIFDVKDGNYYILTNQHVVDLTAGAVKAEYLIIDAFGNEYIANLVCEDAEYDLAVLRFEQGEKELLALELSNRIPDEREPIISLGQPKGQYNSITYGNAVDYEEIASKTDDDSLMKVSFAVIWHSAYLNHGSSGGALLDLDFKLIGVNFASSTTEGNTFQYGFAIPAEKVLEFLEKNGITVPVSN